MSRAGGHSKFLTSSGSNNKLKVIVIGDSNVGKTSLTYRFCEGSFLVDVEATLGVDFKRRTLNVDGENITLQLWDTAGQERFHQSLVSSYYRNVDAVILVYDMTNRSSFLSLPSWIAECDNNCPLDILKIMVGNKCDGIAEVDRNEALLFASKHGMPFFETSAQLDSEYNIEAIFVTLARKVKSRRPLIRKPTEIIMLHPVISTGKMYKDDSCSWC